MGGDYLVWRRANLAKHRRGPGAQSLPVAQPSLSGAILRRMKVEEKAVVKLPPDQLVRFRRWFTAFEAGRTNHAEELHSLRLNSAASPAARLLN